MSRATGRSDRRPWHLAILLPLSAAVVIGGITLEPEGNIHTVATTTTTTTPAYRSAVAASRASAGSLAQALLAQVTLPPATTRLSSAPDQWLRQPAMVPGTPNLADAIAFARSPLSEAGTMAYFRSHPPSGFSPNQATGVTSLRTGAEQPNLIMLGISQLPAGVASASFLIAVAPQSSGAGSDVRMDVMIAWLLPKPLGFTVPPADRVAIVRVTQSGPPRAGSPALPRPRQVTVTDPSAVAELRSAADGLTTVLPGARNCPMDSGTRYRVEFAVAVRDRPNITFTAGDPCGIVEVVNASGGRTTLQGDTAFSTAYRQALGLPPLP